MIAVKRSIFLGVLTCAGLASGCGGEESSDPVTGEAPVVRPATVETLELELSQQTLPSELGGVDLRVASDVALGTVAGGENGFFVQGSGGFERIDETAVTGLVALEGVGFLVGRADGLRIWDGTLKGTTLDDTVEGAVTALASSDDQVWIGTEDALFLLEGEALSAFEGLGGVSAIDTFAGSDDVLLKDGAGNLSVLRAEGEEWTVRSLEEEPVELALPGAGGRILGVEGGALVERVDVGGGSVAWRPVALSDDASDEGAEGIEAIAVDPSSGALWVIDGAQVARIEGDTVATLDRPDDMSEVVHALVSSDGVLWISDGEGLWSAGSDGEIITFNTHIAPFSEDNCARCHVENGIGHPIVTFDDWVAEADEILNQLETGAMPADSRPLVGGSPDLVRRWIEDGLLEE